MRIGTEGVRTQGNGRSGFDYKSKTWGSYIASKSPFFIGAMRLREALADIESVHGKLLEVGCGAGGMTLGIRRYRPELEFYGCDISHSSLAMASIVADGPQLSVANAHNLPWPDGFFDSVVLFDVLEHLEDPEKALAEVYRVLRPNAVFHLFVPCEGAWHNMQGILCHLGWQAKREIVGHIQYFDESRIRSMLEATGFAVGRSRWSGHFLAQVLDVAYVLRLGLSSDRTSVSVESYLAEERKGLVPKILRLAKDAVALATFAESRLLRGIPGWGIHVACRKLSS